jgi:hypothetical protein
MVNYFATIPNPNTFILEEDIAFLIKSFFIQSSLIPSKQPLMGIIP